MRHLLLLLVMLVLPLFTGCQGSRWAQREGQPVGTVPPSLWVPESIGVVEEVGGQRPEVRAEIGLTGAAVE